MEAQRGERTRFSIPAERTFLSPPSCAHYALAADGSSRTLSSIQPAKHFSNLESERDRDAFVQQAHYFSAPISIGRRLCPLSLARCCLPLDTLLAIVCAADASSYADLYPHAGKMPLSHDTDTAHRVYAASTEGCLTGNGTLSV
jgi:hypothetical protein